MRALLARQHGLITAGQATELGISSSALSRRTGTGELERVLPRVYRSTLWTPTAAQRAFAAVLWAGDGAAASHSTAGALWGLPGVDGCTLEIWVPRLRAPRSPNVVVHRGELAAIDRRRRDGVPVTSAARTLVDLAGALAPEDLEAALEDALRRGLTTPTSVWHRLEAVGPKGRRGAGRLRGLLADRDGAALESRLEVKLWRLLRGAGFRPARQHRVRVGDRAYRLDFAWPALKVGIEADGFSAHGGRRAFINDRRRLADLAAAGWIIVVVTWDDCVDRPEAVVERIRAVLLRAAA